MDSRFDFDTPELVTLLFTSCFHNLGLAVLVVLSLALVTWLIRERKTTFAESLGNHHCRIARPIYICKKYILQNRQKKLLVSSSHRGCALIAVTVILAACVSVDDGIEDFFVRQALPEVAGLGTAHC